MSYIAFKTEAARAEVRGPERAMAGILARDLFMACLHVDIYRDREPLWAIVENVPEYLKGRTADAFSPGALGDGPTFRIGDDRITAYDASINTMIGIGSDALAFMARLHASCEGHLWIDEPDRPWLADVIEAGRKQALLRDEMGWEAVVALLRNPDAPGPVVTDFSGTESFPRPEVAGWIPTRVNEYGEGDWDEWYDLPRETQWAQCIAGLRSRWVGLQLTQKNLREVFFGPEAHHPQTAFTIRAEANRVAAESLT